MYQRILVATDGSRHSQKAVSRAIGLAAENHCELIALTVVPRRALDYAESAGADSEGAGAGSLGAAQDALDAVQREAAACGVLVRAGAVVSDHVAEAIVDASRLQRSDLIVMGRSGAARWSGLLGAGKTRRVLESSGLPTLVVQ
jgi:nucleotide-binding universal stress UspA family protein